MAETESLLATLMSTGWRVTRRGRSEALLPDQVKSRYSRLPADVECFLGELEACVNRNETVWFLTHNDYGQNRDGHFRWNQHEIMCLDAAGDEDEDMDRIRAFWDCHFPFMFAVHSDYDYLAVDLNPEFYGQIVHGYMPEPEHPSPVARSFSEFVLMFMETLRGKHQYPLSLFI